MARLAAVVALVVIGAVAVATPASDAALPGKGKTLTFGYGMWSADNPATYVSKVLLEDYLGYKVEVAELTIPAVWVAMADGQVDVYANAWFPNQAYLLEAYKDRIEIISTHYDDSFTALIVPTWLAEQHDVWSMEDLFRPEVIQLFDRDRDGKGDLLGCDVAWTCYEYMEEKLQHYGLDKYYVQHSIAEQMVTFEVIRAMESREPFLWLGWSPGWMFSLYKIGDDLTLLTDPWGYHSDPQGGVIDEFGWPPGIATTAVHKSVKENHPEAYRLLSEISVSLDHQNDWIYAQARGGVDSPRKLEQYARDWIAKNRGLVDSWLENAGIR